jgi:hypothetical protein
MQIGVEIVEANSMWFRAFASPVGPGAGANQETPYLLKKEYSSIPGALGEHGDWTLVHTLASSLGVVSISRRVFWRSWPLRSLLKESPWSVQRNRPRTLRVPRMEPQAVPILGEWPTSWHPEEAYIPGR